MSDKTFKDAIALLDKMPSTKTLIPKSGNLPLASDRVTLIVAKPIANSFGDALTFNDLCDLKENDWIIGIDTESNLDWKIIVDNRTVNVGADSVRIYGNVNLRVGWNRPHDYEPNSCVEVMAQRLIDGHVKVYRLAKD